SAPQPDHNRAAAGPEPRPGTIRCMTTATTTQSPTTTPDPTPRSLVAGVHHVGVVTGDLERLVAFYVAAFDAAVLDVPAPPGTRAAVVQLAPTSGLAVVEEVGNPHA